MRANCATLLNLCKAPLQKVSVNIVLSKTAYKPHTAKRTIFMSKLDVGKTCTIEIESESELNTCG